MEIIFLGHISQLYYIRIGAKMGSECRYKIHVPKTAF